MIGGEDCKFCEKAKAVVGLIVSLTILYISLDILLNGKLTRFISPPVIETDLVEIEEE